MWDNPIEGQHIDMIAWKLGVWLGEEVCDEHGYERLDSIESSVQLPQVLFHFHFTFPLHSNVSHLQLSQHNCNTYTVMKRALAYYWKPQAILNRQSKSKDLEKLMMIEQPGRFSLSLVLEKQAGSMCRYQQGFPQCKSAPSSGVLHMYWVHHQRGFAEILFSWTSL